jgi:hypothetical protein
MKNYICLIAIAQLSVAVATAQDSDVVWSLDGSNFENQAVGAKFSPDNQFIVNWFGTKLQLRHTATGALIWGKNNNFAITEAIFDNTGQRIITAYSTTSHDAPKPLIKIFDANTGDIINDDLLNNYEKKNSFIKVLSISLTTDEILYALIMPEEGDMAPILSIDLNTGNVIKEYNPGRGSFKITISKNNQNLALWKSNSAGDKFEVQIYKLPSFKFFGTFDFSDDEINDIAFSPDSRLIGAAGIGACKIWDVETKQLMNTIIEDDKFEYFKIKFSPNSQNVIISNVSLQLENSNTQIYNIKNNTKYYEYSLSASQALDISFDSKFILVSGEDAKLALYNAHWEPTAIKDDPPKENIIYPNPVTGIVTIKYDINIPDKYTVNLTDINGIQIEKIYEGFYEPGIKLISYNTSKLPAGVYFINISNSATTDSYKIVKGK